MAVLTFTIADSLFDAFIEISLKGDNSQSALDRGITELMRSYVESRETSKKIK